MTSDNLVDEKGFVIDVGRASEGRTFVKVRHVESSLSAFRVGIGNMSTKDVARELMAEIFEKLACSKGQEVELHVRQKLVAELANIKSQAQQSAHDAIERIRCSLGRVADENLDLEQALEVVGSPLVDWLNGLGLQSDDELYAYFAGWLGHEFCEKILDHKLFLRRDLSELNENTFRFRELLPCTSSLREPILATHQFLVAMSSNRSDAKQSKCCQAGARIFDQLDSEYHTDIIPIE